jgi:hypothetical protein
MTILSILKFVNFSSKTSLMLQAIMSKDEMEVFNRDLHQFSLRQNNQEIKPEN